MSVYKQLPEGRAGDLLVRLLQELGADVAELAEALAGERGAARIGEGDILAAWEMIVRPATQAPPPAGAFPLTPRARCAR